MLFDRSAACDVKLHRLEKQSIIARPCNYLPPMTEAETVSLAAPWSVQKNESVHLSLASAPIGSAVV